ncbi:MAG: hypothetical protein WKG32_18870 [Gemmatimonadaceae bacterium]
MRTTRKAWARPVPRTVLAASRRVARSRIFLISPATAHGARGRALTAPDARTPSALRLHSPDGMPLGAVFRYLSGLYFNGKLAYATTFARPPARLRGAGIQIITMTDGLRVPETPTRANDLRRFAAAEQGSDAGRTALERSARELAGALGSRCDVILLGSLATGKYTDVLLPVFGRRLLFPREMLGRGQLDRGALLFRCVREERELEYAPVAELSSGLGGGPLAGARP